MNVADIGRKLVALEARLARIEASPRLSHASIDDTSVQVRDGAGGLRGLLGMQADGTTAVNVVNGPPPPQPSPPLVASVLGGVSAGWDGLFADGQILPLDWSRTEVHAATTAVYTPSADTLQSTIETAQGATVVIPTDDPVYVRLVARNTSGTASLPSAAVGPVGRAPVVANDILDGIVTTVKLAADAVTEAKIAAGAVTMDTLGGALGDTASQRYVDYFRDANSWAQLSAANGGTWTINTTPAGTPSGGGRLIATGEVQVATKTLIPQDSETLYRVMIRVRATAQDPAGLGLVFLGAVGVAEDGVTLVNRAGSNLTSSQLYPCASGISLGTAAGWTTYVGWIQGHSAAGVTAPPGPAPDPRSPEVTHANVRYLRPMLWLNFGKNTASVMEAEAVTVEAVRTGVVGSTNLVAGSVTTGALAADAVTTPKIVAGAVQAGQIAAGAVLADKIASAAVTTAKLDALSVTADKIAVDAITADKILAGSVTTTALSATAITGKTITGGLLQTATSGERVTINEAGSNMVLVYDSNGIAVGELSTRGLRLKGDSGALAVLDPDATYPNLRFSNAAQNNWAYVQVAEPITGTANLELMGGQFTEGGFTDMRSRLYLAASSLVLERIRALDPAHANYGGRLFIDGTVFNAGFVNSADTSQNTGLSVGANQIYTGNGRLSVSASASSSSALHVEAPTAQTGNLFRLYRDTERFRVDKDGNTVIAGTLTAGNIASGSVNITPSAANTPTSALVTFPALAGTTFRGFATAATTVPGTRVNAVPSAAGVTGVSTSSAASTSMLVHVNRENLTQTTVNWMVIGV